MKPVTIGNILWISMTKLMFLSLFEIVVINLEYRYLILLFRENPVEKKLSIIDYPMK
ncbi:NADH dehydrogenase subunit I [Iris pallida]|uniref:NADH dehydrogenase subunit I (Chloroplast) n=1 Tax=Iris pallida TaxID=29817 RepID=A0AAX6GFH9_IRIPA|nr:NADH dehydrogenase subunit I [Iris pallida]